MMLDVALDAFCQWQAYRIQKQPVTVRTPSERAEATGRRFRTKQRIAPLEASKAERQRIYKQRHRAKRRAERAAAQARRRRA